MNIGKKNPAAKYDVKIENNLQSLDSCTEEKDLSITFDNKLNFVQHISDITKNANQMLGIIKRIFIYIDKDIFSRLYKALVRSHLEYENVVWSPHLKRHSLQIESIQRRVTKLVPQCREMDYGMVWKHFYIPKVSS